MNQVKELSWEEQRAAEAAAFAARIHPHMEAVCKLVSNDWSIEGEKLTIEGVDCTWRLTFMAERTSVSPWRSKPTGKLRCSVMTDGKTQSFPQRKDGTFNYDEIARRLRQFVDQQKHHNNEEATRLHNRQMTEKFIDEVNLNAFGGVRVCPAAVADKLEVEVKFTRNLSPEAAADLIAFLRDRKLIAS